MGQRWPAAGSGALTVAMRVQDLLKEVAIIFITSSLSHRICKIQCKEKEKFIIQKDLLLIYDIFPSIVKCLFSIRELEKKVFNLMFKFVSKNI